MNIVDIIIAVCLVVSVILGFKDGAIRQLGTLAGIIIALFLAKIFGSTVSAILGIGGEYAHIWGYIIVLIVSLIAVGFLAKMLRKIIKAVGLGAIDNIAGAVFALIKCSLLLALAFWIFNFVNVSFKLVDSKIFDESKLHSVVLSSTQYIAPTIDWVSDQLPEVGTKEE
ncbi:MAG: CvpA family protein [Rikenellaceae bacterium]